MFIFTAFIIGFFYCLDALHGERRERSILFWKSLPVSDLTTVLSKAIIPLVVLPVVSFAIIVVTQFIMMLISTAALLPSGLAATTWTNFNLFQQSFILLYGLVAIALWHAPIYGWALLVSGWTRRATFLWAILPLLAVAFFEKITFNTSHFAFMLKDRVMGFAPEAFAFSVHTVGSAALTPGRYLSSAGLWIGLVFAVVFFAAAVRLRRYRGPL
jgi:ABC-2 type transport system permease protein